MFGFLKGTGNGKVTANVLMSGLKARKLSAEEKAAILAKATRAKSGDNEALKAEIAEYQAALIGMNDNARPALGDVFALQLGVPTTDEEKNELTTIKRRIRAALQQWELDADFGREKDGAYPMTIIEFDKDALAETMRKRKAAQEARAAAIKAGTWVPRAERKNGNAAS